MKRFIKTVLFLVLFSTIFFLLRKYGYYIHYDIPALVNDLGGLTYLYSTTAIIFAIFAAFVILSESERWNNLVDAVKGEIIQLNELWLWSRHFPEKLKNKFGDDIKNYLQAAIKNIHETKKSLEVESSINLLHEDIYQVLKESPELIDTTFETFSEILKHREQRVHYLSFHLPKVLKNTLIFSDILLIALSFLIGVKNISLDYIFLLCIGLLGYLIYTVVDDLDNPTRPGGWQLTTKDYQELLHKINQ